MTQQPNPTSPEVRPVRSPTMTNRQSTTTIPLLIYGGPGVGKTRLSATAPSPFILECDPAGALSLQDQECMMWDIQSMAEFREAWNWMGAHMDQFTTIVVDGFTRLQGLGLDELIPATSLEVDRKYWGRSSRQLRSIIEGLMKFNKDVVFVCGERLRDNEINHLKTIVPDLTPSVAALLNYNCRVVGHLSITQVAEGKVAQPVPVLQVHNDGRLWAKDSSGKLGRTILSPNLTAIFSQIRGSKVGQTSRTEVG